MHKKILAGFIVIAFALTGIPVTSFAKDPDLHWHWGKGLRFQSKDKAFAFKFGGRIFHDWAFKNEDAGIRASVGELQNATTEFRAARLYIAGLIYKNVFFKAQYDFVGGDVDWKDVYVGLKGVPVVGKVKVGHFKEPFGLEELTSLRYTTFMERGPTYAFVPDRNSGIAVYNTALKKRVTWAGGLFMDTGSYGGENGSENNFHATVRVTALPWYAGKDKLLHIGFDYSYRDATDNATQIRFRPETHTGPYFVDTGSFAADSENRLGGEAALVYGSFSIQGEFHGSDVDTNSGTNPFLYGYYVYGSFFLTGEHRAYSTSGGAFSRIKPKTIFGKDGIGAWELALRYSTVDLTDEAISGGELDDITVGLNWYLNPNTRVMFNYVRADLDNVGEADIFQARFQIDF